MNFEEDAQAFSVKDEDLASVARLAKRAKTLEEEIKVLEEMLSGLQDQYKKITEESLPEAFSTIGLRSFTMDDGSRCEIKPYYGATINKDRKSEAFQWLRDHHFDDLIKNIVAVHFGRNENELCGRLQNLLAQNGYRFEQSEKIEPQTLKAWVREQLQRGNEVPSDLFGVFVGQKAFFK
jgi:hypothetical protein